MFLALREIRRAKARFGLLMAAVGAAGVPDPHPAGAAERPDHLVRRRDRAPVGAGARVLRRRPADAAGQRDHPGPRAADRAPCRGWRRAGRIGQGTFTVAVDGGEPSDAALIGYDAAGPRRRPTRSAPGGMARAAGEAVGSAGDFSLGDRVRVQGRRRTTGRSCAWSGSPRDAQIQVTPTLFVAWSDYAAATRAANPDATADPPERASACVPRPGSRPRQLTRPRSTTPPREADALTRAQAADEVARRRAGAAVLPADLPALRARRAARDRAVLPHHHPPEVAGRSRCCARSARRRGVLVRSLLVQVLIVIGGGIVLGTLLFAPLSQTTLGLARAAASTRGRCSSGPSCCSSSGCVSAVVAARRVLAHRPDRGDHRRRGAMKLALRELRRRPGRFVVATAILTLIARAADVPRRPARRPDRRAARAPCAPSAPTSSCSRPPRRTRWCAAASRRRCARGRRGRGRRRAGVGPGQRPARRAASRAAARATWSPSCCSATSGAPRGSPTPCPARGRVYADDSLRAEGVRAGRGRPAGPGPHARRGDRLRRRQPLLRAGHPVGLARHVARGARGQPARGAGGRGRRAGARGARRGDLAGRRDRRRHRRRHLHADHLPGDRAAAGRLAAADASSTRSSASPS